MYLRHAKQEDLCVSSSRKPGISAPCGPTDSDNACGKIHVNSTCQDKRNSSIAFSNLPVSDRLMQVEHSRLTGVVCILPYILRQRLLPNLIPAFAVCSPEKRHHGVYTGSESMIQRSQYRRSLCLTVAPSRLQVARLQIVPFPIWTGGLSTGRRGYRFEDEISHFLNVDANAAARHTRPFVPCNLHARTHTPRIYRSNHQQLQNSSPNRS